MDWSEWMEFTSREIENAPAEPGIYRFQCGDLVTYYGQAETSIRHRLEDHRAGYDGSCTQGSKRFAYLLTDNPMTAEQDALRAHEQRYGELPECNAGMR